MTKPKLTTRYYFPVMVLLLLLAAGRGMAQQEGSLSFTVSMERPETHTFHIIFHCKDLAGPVLDLKMPAWMPGYYQVLDYAKKVEHFRALDGGGRELGWAKTSGNTWRVPHEPGMAITVEYDVKASTPFVAQPWLDSTRGYLAPAGIFMYIEGYLHHPVTVEVRPGPSWHRVVTGLDTIAGKQHVFKAPDFDILYDSPILVGNLEELTSFTVRGIPHYFIGYRLGDFDRELFIKELKKVIEAGVNVIDDIPYRHYTFLATGPGRGGIEHLNSTTIGFSGDALKTAEGRRRVLSFIAHEYFHHYNVKRIRPIALGPFDYQRENRTNMLWVSEGLTVYYEYLMVRRAGLMTGEALLHNFQSDMAAYENKPGHLYQSLAQASYETWSNGPFGRTGDSVDRTISYYQKGPVVGLLLDLAIRHATKNKRSLDDVMRSLYQVYYQGKKRGFTDDEFRKTCENLAGIALSEIFEYVFTVKEPDYARYLAYGGLGIELEPHVLPDGKTERSCRIFPLPDPDALQLTIRKSWMGE
jgi:predicted metalloprotease with PDZ domain